MRCTQCVQIVSNTTWNANIRQKNLRVRGVLRQSLFRWKGSRATTRIQQPTTPRTHHLRPQNANAKGSKRLESCLGGVPKPWGGVCLENRMPTAWWIPNSCNRWLFSLTQSPLQLIVYWSSSSFTVSMLYLFNRSSKKYVPSPSTLLRQSSSHLASWKMRNF